MQPSEQAVFREVKGLNPYAPSECSIGEKSEVTHWIGVAYRALGFVVAFVLGIHVYSFYMDGLYNTLIVFFDEGWYWNVAVRLPYLAAIQLVLIVSYAYARQVTLWPHRGALGRLPYLLGFVSAIVRFSAYDLIRVIPEDVIGLEINWTIHYAIIWCACIVATVAVVEATRAFRR